VINQQALSFKQRAVPLGIRQLARGVDGIDALALFVIAPARIELAGETRDVAYAVVPAASFAAAAEVTPAEVAAYYDKNKSQFLTAETVSLQYLKLNLADIAAGVQVTEEGLRKYYEETAAERNAVPERR
jgi:peptidyl-prolyl cis-trans isomerase D